MNTDELIKADSQSHMNTYTRFPVVFTEASGTKLWDINGKEYTDFLSGLGALNLGHCPKSVVDAFCAQAHKLGHISNLFYSRPQIDLADKLLKLVGGRCFFANSGAEANEGAIKLARRWGKVNFSEEKTGFITSLRSFHGRTMATLAATGQPEKNGLFAPLTPGFKHVPFNDIEAMAEAIGTKTCAVMLEVVQGEGGVWPASRDYLKAVRKLCDERQALLIIDEVQTGIGRTGKFLAFEHFDIEPDIVTLAKSLAGGFPIGAVIARGEVADAFGPGDHGSTFGGGPAVCAAALATIEYLEEKRLVERAAVEGEYLKNRLGDLASKTGLVDDVRGLGLMVGITLKKPNARDIVFDLLDKGFLINNIGDRFIRFLPPLIISEAEIEQMLEALEKTLEVENAKET